jgi:hypothetical protein
VKHVAVIVIAMRHCIKSDVNIRESKELFMNNKIPETYAELKHRVLLTGIHGGWRDLGNQKQYRAKNGAILNWWDSTGTITFQGQGLAAKKLEVALGGSISPCQSNIAAKASEAGHLRDQQDCSTQRSSKSNRSVGVLRKAKITTNHYLRTLVVICTFNGIHLQ